MIKGVNLSQFVQEQINEAMRPSDNELAQAYRDNAEQAREMNAEWNTVSREATQHLDDSPDWTGEQ